MSAGQGTLPERNTPLPMPDAEGERVIGFGQPYGDFVMEHNAGETYNAHDEAPEDLTGRTKVPEGTTQFFGEQRQEIELQQQQKRAAQYQDVAAEGIDMSDADLSASGVQTMEDMQRNAMTPAEAQRHEAAQRAARVQKQIRGGQEAYDDAEDMPASAVQDIVNMDKGTPLSPERLKQVEKDAAFAQGYRLDIGSGDQPLMEKTMAELDYMKIYNPEGYKKLGKETHMLHEAYKEYYEEGVKNGLSSDEIRKGAFNQTNNYGARLYSPIAVLDSARRSINDAVTGVKFYGNNPVDQAAYEKMHKASMSPGFANSEEGKTIYEAADAGVGFVASRFIPPLIKAPLDFVQASGKEAYRQAKAGSSRMDQHKAAVVRGVADAAGSASPVPIVGDLLDDEAVRYNDRHYGPRKKDKK